MLFNLVFGRKKTGIFTMCGLEFSEIHSETQCILGKKLDFRHSANLNR